MDVYPKFILEDGDLIIAKCTIHKELVTDKEKVSGGGTWRKKDDTFTLFGQSQDFGPSKAEDLKKAVQEGRVYTSSARIRSIAENYRFLYEEDGETTDLSQSG